LKEYIDQQYGSLRTLIYWAAGIIIGLLITIIVKLFLG
jgi:hypothetical protein